MLLIALHMCALYRRYSLTAIAMAAAIGKAVAAAAEARVCDSRAPRCGGDVRPVHTARSRVHTHAQMFSRIRSITKLVPNLKNIHQPVVNPHFGVWVQLVMFLHVGQRCWQLI